MTIELDKQARKEAIASLERSANMDEPIGNIAAAALLGFFVEGTSPLICNKAVADRRAGAFAGARQ